MEDSNLARVRGYIERIKTLSDATNNDVTFADSLKKQRWILVAASEASADDGFRAICVQLQHLIDTDAFPEQIRHYSTELINRARELALRASHERRKELFTLTWWTAVASLSFTLLAILFGDQGIVRVIQQLVSPAPSPDSPHQSPTPILEGSIALIHVVLILIFLYFHLAFRSRQRVEDLPSGQIAREALKQFRRGWMYIWVTYLALYLWFTICWFNKGLYADREPLMWSIADVFNIANAVAFFYCFLVLDKPSVTTLLEPDRPRAFHLNLLGVVEWL